MMLGTRGLTLIKQFEGCRLTAYQDQRGVWTIGYGHVAPYVVQGLTCTQEQADDWLVEDTGKAQGAVHTLVDVPLSQNQFDALTSFTFNVGVGAFEGSTLLKDLNENAIAPAADQFLVWDHVNGAPNDGLLRRRTAERALFLTP